MGVQRGLLFSMSLLVVACGASESDGAPRQAGRGVLVIAVDALRYDHTNFGGYDRDTTPRLQEWFEGKGVVFADAWSPGPSILPAHVSLLTGCDPSLALRPDVILSDGSLQPPITDWYLPAGMPTIADEFLGAGWRTSAFLDHMFLEERRGIERGFREFEEAESWNDERQPYLSGVAARFFDWVDDLEDEEDWFSYVHFNDLEARWTDRWLRQGPSLPPRYDPRPELDYLPAIASRSPTFFALPASRLIGERQTLAEYEVHYDTTLRWLDTSLRRLLGMLDDRGYLRRTTVVITGTYGVGFGESGLLVESGGYSPADLHVPLLLRPANRSGIESGRRVEGLVSLADVGPTLLALNGLPIPDGMHGKNLIPLMRGDLESVREMLFASHGLMRGVAVVTETHQYAWFDPRSGRFAKHLAASWYGNSRDHSDGGVRVLVDREAPASEWLSGVRSDLGSDPVAGPLHAAAEAWYSDLDRARQVLHPTPWNEDARTPQIIRELQARGLLGTSR